MSKLHKKLETNIKGIICQYSDSRFIVIFFGSGTIKFLYKDNII